MLFLVKIIETQCLFLQLWVWVAVGDSFDPTKFDYCSVKCPPKDKQRKHTACVCEMEDGNNEILERIVEFREHMVERHNYYRNLVATGEQKDNSVIPKAADMHVINYDMELEYISRCHLRSFTKNYGSYHDQCRLKHNDFNCGQNLFGMTGLTGKFDGEIVDVDYVSIGDRAVKIWYMEIKDVPDTPVSVIDSYDDKATEKKIGHFTQLTFGATTHIGCSRSFNPKRNLTGRFRDRAYTNAICCYYAGLTKWDSGNIRTKKIYTRGEPCSKCPAGTTCNKQYPGLCGELLPVPKDEPVAIAKVDSIGPNFKLSLLCLLTLFLIADAMKRQ